MTDERLHVNPPAPQRWESWVWPAALLAAWGWILTYQCPSIGLGDCGETVTAAWTLGVSHPPGHPLGELLGRLMTFLPLGTVAFRVNLLSSLAVMLSAWLVGWTVKERLVASGLCSTPAAWGWSVLGAWTLILNPLVLEQALSAKGTVYTLSLLFSMCVLRSARFDGETSEKDLWKVAFWEGLALATHWPTALAGAGLAAWWAWERGPWKARAWMGAAVACWIGLTAYLLLPIRSVRDPVLDWGHPTNVASFGWLISRANYTGLESAGRTVWGVLRQCGVEGRTLLLAFPWAVLAVVGFIFLRRRHPGASRAYAAGLAIPVLAVAVVPVLTKETDYLVSAYLTAFQGLWVLLATLGAAETFRAAARAGRVLLFFAACLMAVALGWFAWGVPRWDISRWLLPHDLGVGVLQSLPKDAVLLGEGDTYVLAVLHDQQVEGLRKDVRLVPTIFLSEEWGFDQALRTVAPMRKPPYPPATFAERVGFFVSLGAPLQGVPERNVFVSTANGSFSKAGTDPSVHLDPWGLTYLLTRRVTDPTEQRGRVWGQSASQRWRALENPRRVLRNNPRARELFGYYANPFILSGNEMQQAGRFLEASDDYSKALEILPDGAEAYSNLAAVAGASGLHELAETFCKKALAADPNYAGAWDNLGNVYSLEGAWDEALDAYERALAIQPDSPATRSNRDRAARSQKEGKIGSVSRHDVKWYMDLGVSYYNQQRWAMAGGIFETVLSTGMDTAAVWGDIGVVRAQMGDPLGARQAFENSLQRDERFVETYKNYALLEIQQGRRDEARRILEKGEALQPGNTEIQTLLSSLDR